MIEGLYIVRACRIYTPTTHILRTLGQTAHHSCPPHYFEHDDNDINKFENDDNTTIIK